MTGEHVNGKNVGKVVLYAISTCGWCEKTDSCSGPPESRLILSMLTCWKAPSRTMRWISSKRWNPHGSFPTLVINDRKSIVGFREKEIREALGL